jgi:hypothetical protein
MAVAGRSSGYWAALREDRGAVHLRLARLLKSEVSQPRGVQRDHAARLGALVILAYNIDAGGCCGVGALYHQLTDGFAYFAETFRGRANEMA